MKIDGASALIAGGASGLGAATARRLHAGGAHVTIADLNEEKGNALAEELGERARFASCDVTDSDQVQAAVAAAREVGDLRITVCCAGIGWAARTLDKNGPHDLDLFKTRDRRQPDRHVQRACASPPRRCRRTSPTRAASAA